MQIDAMEEVAQGRVWTGAQAIDIGLVDAIGGISTALAIAKQAIGVPEEEPVTVLEVTAKGGGVGVGVGAAMSTAMEVVETGKCL